MLLEEKNEEIFESLLQGFIKKFEDGPETKEFVTYFKTYYVNQIEKWAMSFRNSPHANTETNMFAEAFHNKLKTFYMDRKPNKRLDDLINLLLVIE